MHSNEDHSPLYLFIQLKPYPHTFGRNQYSYVISNSIWLIMLQREVTGCFNYSVNNGKWDILKSEMYGVSQAHVQDNFA